MSDDTNQDLDTDTEPVEYAQTDQNRNNQTDGVRYGIDNNPRNDPAKGAALGGIGGVAVGAAAGAMAGPVGAVIGGVVGAVVGAGASGAAVAGVDKVDNDATVTGIGHTPRDLADTPDNSLTDADVREPAWDAASGRRWNESSPTVGSGTTVDDEQLNNRQWDAEQEARTNTPDPNQAAAKEQNSAWADKPITQGTDLTDETVDKPGRATPNY